MKKIIFAVAMVLAFPVTALSQFCSNCIYNSAALQNAQMNIGTATVRGTLTVGTLVLAEMSVSGTLTAGQLVGAGSGITALNASELGSGTVPSARVTGAYAGITGLGTVASGVWNGTAVGTQYGGLGGDFSSTPVGYLPYFSATGVVSTLAPGTTGKLLQSNGAGSAPSYTGAPTVLGTNVTAIPLANLVTGDLPSAIKATDASLVSVSAAKVIGNISGNAANISGTLALGQLGNGTLPTTIVASSITATGVTPGYIGGSGEALTLLLGSDGRIISAAVSHIPGVSTYTAFTDTDNNWIAAQTSQSSWTFKDDVGVEGTLTLDNALAVASGGTGNDWSAVATGALPYFTGTGALGTLASSVNGYVLTLSGGLPVWSAASRSATHLSGGTAGAIPYQSAPDVTDFLPAMSDGSIVIGAGFGVAPTTGTLTGTANQVVVTRNGTGIVLSGPQSLGTGSSPTFAGLTLSSPLTVANGGTGQATLTANGVLVGNGTGGLISLPAMGAAGIITGSGTGVQPSTGTLTGTANRVTVTQTGSDIILSGPQDLGTGSSPSFVTVTANLTGTASNATLATTATNLGSGGVGQIPYQSGSGATAFLPAMGAGGIITGNGTSVIPSTGTFTGTANQVIITRTGSNIVLSGPQDLGTGSSPTFNTVTATLSGNATTATTATNLAGGAAGRIPMQTASGTTTLLPAMGALGLIVGNGTSAEASTATLTGTANQVTVTQSATAVTLSLPQSINSGATPTFTGTNFSGIPAATALTGQVPIANGGTNLSSAGSTANRVLRTSDGSTFVMGQVIGPDIAASTIPVSALNQSGASDTNVLAWSNSASAWVPSAAAAGNVINTQSNSFNTAGTNQTFGSSVTINGGVFGIVDRSTWTYLPGGIQTTNAFGTCITSTVTMTTDGVTPLEIWFDGSASENSTQECGINVLMDGAFISPFSATVAMKTLTPISTQCQPVYFSKIVAPPSAGSHSWCVTTACNSSINFTIVGRSTVCPYQSLRNEGTQFGVRQWHTNQ